MKNLYKNNSSKSRGFQGIIKKLGQLLCYCPHKSSQIFQNISIWFNFRECFSPHRLHRWTQMFCRVMRFFLHRFDFVELKVLSNYTDYCRRKRRWLMNKTSRMAGAIEAPTICAIRKNLSEKEFVSICAICGQENTSETSIIWFVLNDLTPTSWRFSP